MAVLRGALREWKVLTIAVAAGFLDLNNPYRVGIQRQRRTLRFFRILPLAPFLRCASFCSSAGPSFVPTGKRIGKVVKNSWHNYFMP
ncbi:hypothetical protein ABH894_004613 [Paenibacillus sp. RC62]